MFVTLVTISPIRYLTWEINIDYKHNKHNKHNRHNLVERFIYDLYIDYSTMKVVGVK